MNKLADNMRKFWNTTDARNAHLGISGEAEDMVSRYKALVTDKINVKGKRIIDFGHGGGLLGKYLLGECGIGHYIGYDIADRSNKVASENMAEFDNKELILLKEHRWNFAEKEPDIIVALACMFHFPTLIYLNNFLKTVNESGAKRVILEVRNTGKGTNVRKEAYTWQSSKMAYTTCLTCETDEEYVSKQLTNYKLVEKTDPTKAPTRCQILWYKKKGKND